MKKENNSMSVKLTTQEKGDVIIVDASGRLTLGEGTSAPRKRIPLRQSVDGLRPHGRLKRRRQPTGE